MNNGNTGVYMFVACPFPNSLVTRAAQVQFQEKNLISRETLVKNEALVTITLSHLGTRVCVRSLEVHIQALYDLMQIVVPRSSHKSKSRIFVFLGIVLLA